MTLAYIAGGSNLGDRLQFLQKAGELLAASDSVQVKRRAGIYETEPAGGPPQGKYLNTVWEIETEFSAQDLLNYLFSVERQLGRERTVKNAPRTLDLDILFYGNKVIREEDLKIPHPCLQERLFVLQPLLDLAPDFQDPASGKPVKTLWKEASAGRPSLKKIEDH